MLEPDSRQLYLEALRPPSGYRLDQAIATTFSLDLLALLMAPLALVFAEPGDREDLLRDPIAFLEALRRTRDRLVVFCQAGRIAVPKLDTRLYSYLEPIVVEVQAPGEGVFHPKIWLLRFAPSDPTQPVVYRLLCLSRNLTFDRSWDTLLSLEGCLDDRRQRGFGLNRPLADFIRALPSLTLPGSRLSPTSRVLVERLAEEVGRVRFEVPAGFEEIVAFRPSGIAGHKKLPFPRDYDRLLVVSPFLTGDWLQSRLSTGRDNRLISRPDSLDALTAPVLAGLETNTTLYILNETAERPEEEEPDGEETQPATGPDLSGLHAKLFLAERGWNATVLTGSANASKPAFDGSNVEFMVELRGKRSQVGLDRLLGAEGQTPSLLSLLQRYQRSGDIPPVDLKLQRRLEQILDEARRALIAAGPSLRVSPDEGDTYHLTLATTTPLTFGGQAVSGCCAPISLHFGQARDLAPLLAGQALLFPQLSPVGLTGFCAFELRTELDGQAAGTSFVLNLPVEGLPADREQRLLHSIIADKSRFIRYLLLLLAEDEEVSLTDLVGSTQTNGQGPGYSLTGLPLLEELVRASSRQPEKIDRIAALVENLSQTGAAQDILPEGFNQIWTAFLALRLPGERL